MELLHRERHPAQKGTKVVSNILPIAQYESITNLLTADEQVIVKDLINATGSASEVLPDDMDPTNIWRYLAATCKGVRRTQEAASKLKFFLGRILVLVQANPEIHTSQGYVNFNDFITDGVPKLFGISRPEGFIVKKIDEELSSMLTIDELQDIGISKANFMANIFRQRLPPGTLPEIRTELTTKWIDRSRTMSLDEMKAEAVKENMAEDGDLDLVSVIFHLKESTYNRLKEFRSQPWVRVKAGESDTDVMEAFMGECSSWEAEAIEAMESVPAEEKWANGPTDD